MEESFKKNIKESAVGRNSSIPKQFDVIEKRNRASKLPKKDKLFIEEILKRNMEKTIKIFKATIPSYFSKHYKRKEETKGMFEVDTVNRLSSPQPASSKKLGKNFPLLISVHPVVPLLQMSNGIELFRVIEPNYKYFVGPGNNHSLIKKILKSRPGWFKVFTPHSANLIWTDVKKSSVIELIPKGKQLSKTLVAPKEFEYNLLPKDEYTALATSITLNPLKIKIYNKIEGNSELASKKKLFINMLNYYTSLKKNPFDNIPLTFHITQGSKDQNFQNFLEKFEETKKSMETDSFLNNFWVIKPGEATNRGIGISVCSTLEEITACVNEKKTVGGIQRTYIIQKYLYKPLLYNNRKFDIRCYALVTVINTNVQAYFYKEGYLRTSCLEFSMSTENKFIHLTNDAVQKNSPDYGKFEDSNKLSFKEFQEYIDQKLEKKINFREDLYPKIKEIVKDTIKATYKNLDPNKRTHCFEVFGYDFMIDEDFHPWLIEVNTNPCLVLSGTYLKQLIPMMLVHSFEITLDQLFPSNSSYFESNLYELIFSENSCKLNSS